MTALERAAISVQEAISDAFFDSVEPDPKEIVRSVLMAVREPDKNMLLAIAAESYADSSGYTRWQAGIDAILNEKDTTNG